MPLILGANSATGGYTVKDSLRFNSGSTDYLSRTFSSTPTTWTASAWVKKCAIATGNGLIFGSRKSGSGSAYLYFNSSDNLANINNTTGATTTSVYRDSSAWYHVFATWDSSNNATVYVNGSLVTTTAVGSASQLFTSSWTNCIGKSGDGTGYLDGYLAEVYFIDGQVLTPSSFGQTDPSTPSSGIWIPKAYTGSYSGQSFYLKFQNSASLGTDSSGLGNNWTTNGGIAATSQSTDTPTNNFATLNPLNGSVGSSIDAPTLSYGNLRQIGSTNWSAALAGVGTTTGKWYSEYKVTAIGGSNYADVGITSINSGASSSLHSSSGSGIFYNSNGQKWVDGTASSYGATYTTGDIISILLDQIGNTVTFYKNGSSQGSINLTSSVTSSFVFFAIENLSSSTTMDCNFGSPSYSSNGYQDAAGYGNFSYAVPSGYYALCSANLAKYG